MSDLENARSVIREAVAEQHGTNGGQVDAHLVAHNAQYEIREDDDRTDAVIYDWSLSQARAMSRRLKDEDGLRALIPDGAGTYRSPMDKQLTLEGLELYAERVFKSNRTQMALAREVRQIVRAARERGASADAAPSSVLTAEEIATVRRLTQAA